MKKNVMLLLVLAFLLMGCSNEKSITEIASEKFEDDDVIEVIINGLSGDDEKENAADPTPTEELATDEVSILELKDYEQVAFDYFSLFHNTDNLDQKKQYFDNYIHEEVQQAFSLSLSAVVDDDMKFLNPKYVSSADYNADGVVDGKVVLFTSEDKEAVVLINNGKLGWVFYSTDSNTTGFDSVRELLK